MIKPTATTFRDYDNYCGGRMIRNGGVFSILQKKDCFFVGDWRGGAQHSYILFQCSLADLIGEELNGNNENYYCISKLLKYYARGIISETNLNTI